jgi:hypothetical protein
LYLPSKIVNADNKEKENKEAKQNETTTLVPLRGMKEIKKRASDDIQVEKNVRNVRNRTIAKRHILYTQEGENNLPLCPSRS